MGLFDKLKNVLFEEEEVEIPVITKTETKPKETQLVQEQRVKRTERRLADEVVEDRTPLRKEPETINKFRNVKRDIDLDLDFDEKNLEEEKIETPQRVSPFLSFDEDEFERLNSQLRENEKQQIEKVVPKKEVKKEEKKVVQKEEVPKEAPKRFRPSPIISPVYGVLDKNYKKEDIVEKNIGVYIRDGEMDVDTVRKKAYGTLEDEIESALEHEGLPKITEYTDYSYEEDARSIDDILKDTIDDSIEVGEEITQSVPLEEVDNIEEEIVEPIFKEDTAELPNFEEIVEELKSVEDELDDEVTVNEEEKVNDLLEKENTLKMLDEIEKELDEAKETNANLEDTLETDLFNLIDSMYEEEEGEK